MKLTIKIFLLLVFAPVTWAQITQESVAVEPVPQTQSTGSEPAASQPISDNDVNANAVEDLDSTILTLRTLASLKLELQADIEKLNLRLQETESNSRKKDLLAQLERLEQDLKTTSQNIQQIAAGADISSLRSKEQPAFNFQEELFSLLEPAMKEMKDMTSHVRQKTQQRDRLAYYSGKLPTTERAITNIESLLTQTQDATLRITLQSMLEAWVKQRTFLKSEIQSANLQLNKLEKAETSLAESSQGFLKSFFQKRGLYLGRAILVILGILLLSRLLYRAMERYIPGYQRERRSFRVRLLDLIHRGLTGLLLIIGPMIVFYIAEDWLLFSLGILLLLGMALTLRHALPRYWHLGQLFLDVGTVREGERVEMNGLPWLVQRINLYTLLLNPTAGLTKRVKIDDLLDMRSRETQQHEAWFPCRPGDWITFEDRRLAQVVSISEELTELVLRGGAHKTYTTADFLASAPICLSRNFRIKETIGVSYSLQAESVSTMCETLRKHVQQRIEDEGYGEHLLNLGVEFELANVSSLDLVVIADYSGELAYAHNRLRRSTQRWCVEACTNHNWEIPFTQVTLHQSS